jgi:hypothetical protein
LLTFKRELFSWLSSAVSALEAARPLSVPLVQHGDRPGEDAAHTPSYHLQCLVAFQPAAVPEVLLLDGDSVNSFAAISDWSGH